MREHRVLRRASKDGPQARAAILRDAAQARGSFRMTVECVGTRLCSGAFTPGPAARLIRRGIVGPADSGRFMAEAADDLSTPLGQETVRKKRRYRLPFSAAQAVAVLMGLFLLAFLGFAVFNDNPFGGEPSARVAIRQAPTAEKSAALPAGAQAP